MEICRITSILPTGIPWRSRQDLDRLDEYLEEDRPDCEIPALSQVSVEGLG